MWKKIERRLDVLSLKKGTLLTQNTDNPEDIFEILEINHTTDYITLLHANGKAEAKFLPTEILAKNKWWAKEK